MEKIDKPMIEIDGELIEIDDERGEDWLDDESVPDSEKLAYFESLNWQPARNLATEYGITSEEQYQEFLKNQAQNNSNN